MVQERAQGGRDAACACLHTRQAVLLLCSVVPGVVGCLAFVVAVRARVVFTVKRSFYPTRAR